jgi:hypothetical protein
LAALRRTHLDSLLRLRSGSTSLALAKPIALTLEIENVAVMQEAIEQRASQRRIAELLPWAMRYTSARIREGLVSLPGNRPGSEVGPP